MDVFIKVAQFLLSLSLLIVLHEFGHYIAARIFKTRVEKFYLFFDAWGKKLFSFKKGDTEYGIGWLPLGGYVKISGMIDESMDKEQMKQPAQTYEFRSKPAWQRLIIMLAGVTVNFILGIFIYIMIAFVWGEDYIKPEGVKLGFAVSDTFKEYGFKDGDKILKVNGETPFDVSEVNKSLFLRNVKEITVKHENGTEETIKLPENIGKIMWEKGVLTPFNERHLAIIDTVLPNTPASKAGIQNHDKVLIINEKPITYWHEFTKQIDSNEVNITLLRGNDTVRVSTKPEILDKKFKKYQLGINSNTKGSVEVEHKDYGVFSSISRGNSIAIDKFKDFIGQFKYVFTKKGAGELGGFIAIGNIFPSTWNWLAFWHITAFLSIMLAVMNLLPIPALDGGHALFVIFEMITGRKPSDKFLEYAQMVGFAILLTLILFANGNDVYKLIKGWF